MNNKAWAAAWDEGFEAGIEWHIRCGRPADTGPPDPPLNPYEAGTKRGGPGDVEVCPCPTPGWTHYTGFHDFVREKENRAIRQACPTCHGTGRHPTRHISCNTCGWVRVALAAATSWRLAKQNAAEDTIAAVRSVLDEWDKRSDRHSGTRIEMHRQIESILTAHTDGFGHHGYLKGRAT